jgi:hypothetical protein
MNSTKANENSQLKLRATFGDVENRRKAPIALRRQAPTILFFLALLAGIAGVWLSFGNQISAAGTIVALQANKLIAQTTVHKAARQQADDGNTTLSKKGGKPKTVKTVKKQTTM